MKETIARLSFRLNKDPKTIEKIYNYYWQYIKEHIEELPLKKDLTEEEFKSLKVNFNIVRLGKLACTYLSYKKLKNKDNYRRKLYDKSKEGKADG